MAVRVYLRELEYRWTVGRQDKVEHFLTMLKSFKLKIIFKKRYKSENYFIT